MSIHQTRIVEKYCDFLNMEHGIQVDGVKKQFLGQSWPVFVPVDYRCDYQDECQRRNQCPIYRNAHMKW